MPERGFATETWGDDWFQELLRNQRYLFIYLWTNNHCNQAGLYYITPTTMAFETKFSKEELPELLQSLAPKVIWYPEQNLIWVKNFLRHQAKSTKFIVAAIKFLNSSRIPEDIRNEFEAYNEELLRGVVPSEHVSPTKRECVIIRDDFHCQYCGKEIKNADDYEMDHIIPVTKGGKDNYLNLVAACRQCNQKKLDKTPQEAGMKVPSPTPFHGAQATYILRNDESMREKWLKVFPDRYKVIETILFNIGQYYTKIPSHAGATASASSAVSVSDKEVRVVKGKGELSSEEKEIIQCLGQLKGWQADEDDVHWLQGLRSEYPGFTLAEFRACVDYHSGKPVPKHKGIWKNRFRNWMIKKQEFEMKGGKGEQRPRQERANPITYIRGSGEDPGKD
ncbi:unnamed protein product [marine sediment metagenome]|uniref:HNH nuclease domain-containing protein n=1 Tax=marine sediment metagenome TaxID=412755 RepID=X1Q9U5_9ZZZZ